MSKILSDMQLREFKEKFFKGDEDIFSIILSIDGDIVHCYINGERCIDFKKSEVEEFL